MSVINQNLLLTPEGYQISRSVRLRSSASAYLNRTPASTTNRQTWTWSAWIKRGAVDSGLYVPFSFGDNSGGATDVGAFARFNGNVLEFAEAHSGVNSFALTTTQVFRDPSAWYHFVFSVDTTQATASNRLKIFVNGTQITAFSTATYPSQNFNTSANQSGNAQRIGVIDVDGTVTGQYYDGYMTEVQFIDGQALTPSSFGETDAVTGVWKPKKYTGTYGTNGFFLNFSDNSNNTAATIGKDWSGNGNNWTPNNISVTSGVTYDSMLDVPTPYADGGNGRGNYCTLNPLKIGASYSLTNANLSLAATATVSHQSFGTIGVTSGKWYWEAVVGSTLETYVGIATDLASASSWTGLDANTWSYRNTGAKYNSGANVAYGSAYTTNDVIGVALDMDGGTLTFYKNGTSQGTAYTGITGVIMPAFSPYASGASIAANFGQRPFAYTPPTGFLALNTQNLPDSTIKKGNAYFDATTYTGTGSSLSVTNSGSMQPDLVWVKGRSGVTDHALYDAVRGTTKQLESNSTGAETTEATGLTAFNSGGFTVGALAQMNTNTATYVGWQWKESVSAGFDIVTWAGNSTSGTTIAHSLGVAPKMIITKSRTNASSWVVGIGGMSGFGVNDYLVLQSTGAKGSSSTFYQAYGSSTFTVGVSAADEMNKTGNNYVSYLFAEVAGYSKFGSYTGNGSTDGPFVYLGFRPRYVLIKDTAISSEWGIFDTSRNTFNVVDNYLMPHSSNAEAGAGTFRLDILSNGFKLRNSGAWNTSGDTLIYAAFAENPFKNSLAR
jgi:hypothetical protein